MKLSSKKVELDFLTKNPNKTKEDLEKIQSLSDEIRKIEEEHDKQSSIKDKEILPSKDKEILPSKESENNHIINNNSENLRSAQSSATKIIDDLVSKKLLTIIKQEENPDTSKIDRTRKHNIYKIQGSENVASLKDCLNDVYGELEKKGLAVSKLKKTDNEKEVHGFLIAFPKKYKGTKDILKISDKDIKEILEIESSGEKIEYNYSGDVVGNIDLTKSHSLRIITEEMIKTLKKDRSLESSERI